jgi:hypothetical protein
MKMLSPTHDFTNFLAKGMGKTPAEVLSAVKEEIHGLESASQQEGSPSFAYLQNLSF